MRRVLLFKARHLAIDEEKEGLFSVDGFESPFVLVKAPSLLFPLCLETLSRCSFSLVGKGKASRKILPNKSCCDLFLYIFWGIRCAT